MKIPRKKKKKIPVGMYCYTPLNTTYDENGHYKGYKIKICPFYKHVEGLEGFCKLAKCEVTDQVKECGSKYGWK